MNQPHGQIDQSSLNRKDDHLFRLSLKALILNDNGEILVVKESGRTWWDLPGGGIDHGESIKEAIARELFEEINLSCDFTYSTIDIDEPMRLEKPNVMQIRVIFLVVPESHAFSVGHDSDEIAFMSPSFFKISNDPIERRIYDYSHKIKP